MAKNAWKQRPGPWQELLIVNGVLQRRKLTPTLTPTGKDILVLLSSYPKTLQCPPPWTDGRSGSYPSTHWKRRGEKTPSLPTPRIWEIVLASLSWLQE